MRCLVLGTNDVASAVAHRLWSSGYEVVLVEGPYPTVTRRGMAFADAVFAGRAELVGVWTQRVADPEEALTVLGERRAIPLLVHSEGGDQTRWYQEIREIGQAVGATCLIDARMRKHSQDQPVWRGALPLTIGLGPGFVAGKQVDVAIETSWDGCGAVIWEGPTKELAGEPREIGGLSRERYVYAPVAGLFLTEREVGEQVREGEVVAVIRTAEGQEVVLTAPAGGVLRGLTHRDVPVREGTKVIEVDPRGEAGVWRGLGERPRLIAEGVSRALSEWLAREEAVAQQTGVSP